MTTKPGLILGNFEILAALGSGGMGEVFRARDLELGRIVAIKMLRAEIAGNADLLQRFRREAKTLAALNHPHIAQIYGIAEGTATEGDAEPPRGLVLELVEGDTLEDRIRKGPMDTREALRVASQIADALEAAHAQGVVHRDLKPANIKITPTGSVKVLDFGIALYAAESDAGSSTAFATTAGTIIGTPGYMSPEQIRGQRVDRRTDVWAFGCVLYEMLTGQPAFNGATDADMIGVILQREPDWSRLPQDAPADVGRLLRRCFSKDPAGRLRDMGDIRVLIEDALATPATPVALGQARRRNVAPWLVAGMSLVALAFVAAKFVQQPPPRVSRLQVTLPDSAALTVGYNDRDIAITPDGSKLIYIGNNVSQIFVRPLDSLTPVAVYTGASIGLFVSPDGQWIGFRDRGSFLRKVAVTGGAPPVTLAQVEPGIAAGATWSTDGTIIFASDNATTGLERVSASGGPIEVLTYPDRAQGEADHLWPEMMPDGHSVLFTITSLTGGLEAAQIAVLDLRTGMRKILLRGASHARYIPTGHLVYAQAGTLQAVAFDPDRLELRGTAAATVIPDVFTSSLGGANFDVADDGTMAYVTSDTSRTLVWVDREGRETPIGAPPRPYFLPALSPDGTRLAVYADDQEADIWLWDFNRTTLSRLTTVPGRDALQVWTPDSSRVIFWSERDGGSSLMSQAADRVATAELLRPNASPEYAMDVSPDGSRLIFSSESPETRVDLMEMELGGEHRVTPLLHTRFSEKNGTISPDGRWFAYEADDSGHNEIYVRPYPDLESGVESAVAIVSTAGGTKPIWTRGGRELIYAAPTGALMRVEVSSGPTWSATTPVVAVKEGYVTNPAWWGRSYDVTEDGERFLMIKEGVPEGGAQPTSFVVVQNWFEELNRLVPVN